MKKYTEVVQYANEIFLSSLIVPSRAPVNISTSPINSTSFSVTWQPVPLDHMNGIVLGYKISLENMDDATEVSVETVHVNQTMIVLRESTAASRFCVRLLAFTIKGDGEKSDCVEGWTWSESKSNFYLLRCRRGKLAMQFLR